MILLREAGSTSGTVNMFKGRIPMQRIVAFTDGACSGNPGPGGWGVLLQAHNDRGLIKERELCGGEPATTNNRMELTAAIEALQALTARTTITIWTDSTYVRDGITKWIHRWKSNGWKTAGKASVRNVDLWQRLDDMQQQHDVRWKWVKGHADNPGNERADELARNGMKSVR